jgi:GT2 family glycosyltransferase
MDISVVIATRNRLPVLQDTLNALSEQECAEVRAEVVVVDNGSSDGTAAWVASASATFPMRLRLVFEVDGGASAARNRGVAAADGQLVLFLNDDTTPACKDLLRQHVVAHREIDTDSAVLGRTSYPESELADPFMAWLESGAQFEYAALDRGTEPGPSHYYSSHLSFPRSRYLAIGGMDERIPYLFEDSELGRRMWDSGVGLRYRPDLVVIHHHRMTLETWRWRMEKVGAVGAFVNSLYPVQPPIASVAHGFRWQLLSLVDTLISRLPTDWHAAPRKVRGRAYTVAHLGAYGRGYRRAERTG